MKTLKIVVFFLLFGLLLNSCEIEPNHSVRVKNEYSETIKSMKIGSVSYSDVNSGSTADYKPIDEGTHSLSGTTSSGRNLTGTVSLTGKGTHKWTLKILPSGGAEIKED